MIDLVKTANLDLTTVYGIIGVIVVAQFGTIITVMLWLMKGVWWASQKNTEVEQLKKDVNSAFTKIRETQEKEIR